MNITEINIFTHMLDGWPRIDWFIVVYRIEKIHIVGIPANTTIVT